MLICFSFYFSLTCKPFVRHGIKAQVSLAAQQIAGLHHPLHTRRSTPQLVFKHGGAIASDGWLHAGN
jgi:hypothetical protein